MSFDTQHRARTRAHLQRLGDAAVAVNNLRANSVARIRNERDGVAEVWQYAVVGLDATARGMNNSDNTMCS